METKKYENRLKKDNWILKGVITAMAVAAFATAAMAHPFGYYGNVSQLNVRLHNNKAFTLILDGRAVNPSSNTATVNALLPGPHRVRVVQEMPVALNQHGGHRIVVFNGFITIPAGSKIFAVVDRYNRFRFLSDLPLYPDPVHSNGGYGAYFDDQTPAVQATTIGYTLGSGCMSSLAFVQLKQAVANASFDNTKLRIASQGIKGNRMSSAQVLDLMSCLTFESTKLKLAKFAYDHTVDLENYYIVNSGFTFSSSIDALDQYMSWY